jgi:oligopeptide transport system ATP-binding protein
METLLEVRDLTTRFYIHEGVVNAVNGISFTIGEGETLGIVGESGCGKSVSMLSVMRLLPDPPGKIEAGEVWFKGRNLLKLSQDEMRQLRGREIAMIFQDPMTSLNPVLTVGYQVTEALKTHLGLDDARANQTAADFLQRVGIPNAAERLKDYPHQFSGGMRQRAMIAMSLCCNPSLLIADEPTTALDVTIQAQIIKLMRRFQAELGMSTIWITHDLGVVARLVQRVIVMYAGYIVEDAPVQEMFALPSHPYTQGLLGSLPRLDERTNQRLVSIPGQPPNLIRIPTGCPFVSRCKYRTDHCHVENPTLAEVALKHRVACWEHERTMKGALYG